MKKQFLTFFTVLLALTNWLHTANAQPTVTITPPSGKQTGVFDVTVTFSEAVTGFEQDELVVTSTTDNLLGDGRAAATITVWTAQVDGTNYVATITPVHDGTVSFNVAADVAQDADNKGNTAATEQTVDVSIPETVWMPDANLRTLVRNTMGIKPGFSLSQVKIRRITVTSLNKVVSNPFDPALPKVRNLKGLEYALHLKNLTLRGHRHISDLTPLQHLRLESLDVDNNNISNLTPLESMTSLTSLSVQSHRISNLTPLQNLTNLRTLVLRY